MSIPKSPSPAALFMAVLFVQKIPVEDMCSVISTEFGDILLQSQIFSFDFSNYYSAEMGENLRKTFFLLNRLINPETLVEWKLRAHEVETKYALHGKRTINIDPGYLDASKLVLATTKNYDHRIYIGHGIYGDVQLRFRHQHFQANDWTYPDYCKPEHMVFFEQARLKYFDLLKTEFSPQEFFKADEAPAEKLDYKSAGVDREKGEGVKKKISEHVRRTFNKNVLREIGLFGGFFRLPKENYREPVLVASVDGVGTKIKLACQLKRFRGIGQDVVHHCLNDIMVGGAQPLFFLDYLAFGKLNPAVVVELIEGMTAACEAAGCALIGGETAEMPDIYQPDEFDLAGTMVGVVEKEKILDGHNIEPGDVLVGIASNGLHTNGYSLARKIIAMSPELTLENYYLELGETLGEALLKPHRSYQRAIRLAMQFPELHGISHITGGGIEGNTSRLLRNNLKLNINWQAWEWPPLFQLLRQIWESPPLFRLQKFDQGEEAEMRRVFNLGIGLVFVIAPTAVDELRRRLMEIGETSWVIGEVV